MEKDERMMDLSAEGETVKRLCHFLPTDLRLKILRTAKENGNADILRDMKEEEALEDFPRILAFALMNFPQAREMLKNDLLGEIESLCEELGLEKRESQKNNLERFMGHIDEESREIIRYLLRNRYAGIRDLSDLIGASSDNDVLVRIREVINPIAKKSLGREIIEFKQSEIDENSGEKVTFKWWLRDFDDSQLIKRREELLDVSDGLGEIRITAELPLGIEEENIDVIIDNNDIIS